VIRGIQRRKVFRSIVERHQRRTRSEAGDTLVEILLAITVISIAGVALLSAFTTSISASSEYKNLATLDSSLKSFVESVTYQMEFKSPSTFVPCATANSDGSGSYQALNTTQGIYSLQLTGIEYWVVSTNSWSSNIADCQTTPPSQELLTATVTNTVNHSSESIQFAVNDPAFAPANPAAPVFTSGSTDVISMSTAPNFPVTTTGGQPTPALSVSGQPSWVTFIDNGGGDGTLYFNPAGGASPGNTYTFTLTATNGLGPVNQTFTLKVSSVPFITSANSDTIGTLAAPPFTVTSTGVPTPTLTATGLPPWASFTDHGDGTGTLGFLLPLAGTYNFTFTATNSAGSYPQPFTLIVNTIVPAAPVFTTPASDTVPTNEAFTFTVTATGVPTPTLTESGTLPSGVTFNVGTGTNGTISGTLSGTPTNTTNSPVNYPITFTATNVAAPTGVTQSYTLTVNPKSKPTISFPTPSNPETPKQNKPFSFNILGTGFVCSSSGPSATVTWTGSTSLGVTCNNSGSITVSGTAPQGKNTPEKFTVTNPDTGSVQTLSGAFTTS
jgi:hypothetical protein